MQIEKLVVFGPIIGFFLIFGLIILFFLGLVGKLLLKAKNSSWEGKIIDKTSKIIDDFDEGQIEKYKIIVKTSEGKTLNIEVNKTNFEYYKIGDQLRKKKGTLWPEKI